MPGRNFNALSVLQPLSFFLLSLSSFLSLSLLSNSVHLPYENYNRFFLHWSIWRCSLSREIRQQSVTDLGNSFQQTGSTFAVIASRCRQGKFLSSTLTLRSSQASSYLELWHRLSSECLVVGSPFGLINVWQIDSQTQNHVPNCGKQIIYLNQHSDYTHVVFAYEKCSSKLQHLLTASDIVKDTYE